MSGSIRNPPNVIIIQEGGENRIATKNLTPDIQVYGEKLKNCQGIQYRLWSPRRSKLAAMVEKKMAVPLKEDSVVLYLGGGTGTTASHVSDIVEKGRVFVVESSARSMQHLIEVCINRNNMIPILADANNPISYRAVAGSVDVIYQDVAQPNQAEIALANARTFLKPNGYLIMVIKARSIDSSANPKKIFEHEIHVLEKECQILDTRGLQPFHRDHLAIIAQRT